MKTREETTDDALSSTMTASFAGALRHTVFAVAMLAAMDAFEGDSEAATAGELWLDVQNRMKVATDQSH